jgi:hypothetical protein
MTADYPIHPVAALFPMMTDNEIEDLATDIKANGLVHPIILGDWLDGAETVHGLIDGRNRLRACEIAEVEPHYGELNGQDPVAFIISSNISRRHMTVGQIAMTLALSAQLNPKEEEQVSTGTGRNLRGRPKGGQSELARKAGIPQQRISEARLVIEYAPDLIDGVMTHTVALDNAYRTALERKKAEQWRTEGMIKLRRAAPEYADRVDRGELKFEEARTLLANDEQQAAQIRQTSYQILADFARLTDAIANTPELLELPEWLKNEDYAEEFQRYFKGGADQLRVAADQFQPAVGALKPMIARLPKRKGPNQ